MQRTLEQNTKLHALIGVLHLGPDIKADLVYQVSGGRCKSSRDLTVNECSELIRLLESATMSEEKRREDVRKKIIWRLYFMLRERGYFPVQTSSEAMKSLGRMTDKVWKKSVEDMTSSELNACIGIVRTWKTKKNAENFRQTNP